MAGFVALGVCALIIVGGLCFAMGAALGASSNYDQFASLIIPVLSMLGGWVAGVGTLGAVIVALWLHRQQKMDDSESIKVSPTVGFIGGESGYRYFVKLISDGKRPATVTALTINSDYSQMMMSLVSFDPYGDRLPVTLSYGQKADFILQGNFEDQILGYVIKHCDGKLEGLHFQVCSTLRTYKASLEKNYAPLLEGRLNELKKAKAITDAQA